VEAQGSVRTVERTFDTRVYRYRGSRAAFYANATPVKIPGAISGSVTAVLGLESHDHLARRALARPRDLSSPHGYTPADLRHIYNIQPLLDAGVTGKGESIGIISYHVFPADITAFDKEYSLPASTVEQVQVKDPRNTENYSADWEAVAEAEMDTEISHALAPDAHIVLYDDSNDLLDAIYYALAGMVSENRVQVISSSWGGADLDWATFPRLDLVAATHDVLLEAAAQGQTVFSASGDSGAFGAAPDGKRFQTTLMTVYPCSDPYVTCVGGTTLQDTSTGGYGDESAWNNDLGSGGGGISTLFGRPPWQTGPGTDNEHSAASSGRMVPDVSADGDPYSGYAVYVVNSRLVGGDDEWGGTSLAAPLWAGFATLLDQRLGQRIGFFNPTLYTLGTQSASLPAPPFHDVTSGSNLYYTATPGYDLATGWGTPDGAALASDLDELGQIVRTPIVVLSRARIQQKASGTFKTVATVTHGKGARFVVAYTITDGTGTPAGRLEIIKGHASVGTWGMTGPEAIAGTMKRTITLRRAGAYTALMTVADGKYSTTARVSFKVK
jgi:kumamolisin